MKIGLGASQIIMNNWIEKNIIFPKINEIKIKQAKMKQQAALKASILKLVQRKNTSLPPFSETQEKSSRQNYSIQRRKKSTVKKKKILFEPFTLEETKREKQVESSRAQNHIILSVDAFNERKNQFYPAPPKKLSTRIPTTGREMAINKIVQASSRNMTKLKKGNVLKDKLRTDPAQQHQKYEEISYFNIKKAPNYNFNSLERMKGQQKQVQHVSNRPKPKPMQPQEQAYLKVTSIQGWNFQKGQTIQIL